jgi:type IV secretion system protein VirD4
VTEQAEEDEANSGIRREPELPDHEAVAKETPEPLQEFAIVEDKPDELTRRNNALLRRMSRLARQASMHPGNELGL